MDWLIDTKIAHRGLHNADRAENSYSAYSAAIEKGYNIEIDVRLTADNKVVVFHDPTLKRVCGINKKVSSIKSSDLNKYKLKNTEDTIPLFKDFLEFINGRVGLLIEVKISMHHSKKLVDLMMEELKDYKGNYALQSFSPFIVRRIRDFYPGKRVGILAKNFTENFIPKKYRKMLSNVTYFKKMPDFISYEINSFPNENIKKFRDQGIKVLCWTINTPEKLNKVFEYGDNIIFEMPAFPNGLPTALNK